MNDEPEIGVAIEDALTRPIAVFRDHLGQSEPPDATIEVSPFFCAS